MMEKTFRPAEVEAKHYARWEQSGAFAAHADSSARPYTIMMPPPNVTGSLHMGHALTFTLQDILIRYHRMRGFDALWQPGTDHAGIATQMVVERQLAAKGVVLDRPGAAGKRGDNVTTIGRDAFVAKVWEWKAESGGTITRQLRRLGASPDWPRERFTMDEGLSHAVRKVFVDLHKQGLIYRDKRLVNWDPKLQTAISDLEVQNPEVKGHLWHIRYPIEGEPDRHIVIATTRPETMLGDTAVAVHPDDARYKDLRRQDSRCCRWSAARSRSSPTTMPIPRPAPARSRSRRPTTSTISRSAAATTCRASTSSIASPASTRTRRKPIAASTASRRASAWWRTWRRRASSRRSRTTPTRCRTATAATSRSSPG